MTAVKEEQSHGYLSVIIFKKWWHEVGRGKDMEDRTEKS